MLQKRPPRRLDGLKATLFFVVCLVFCFFVFLVFFLQYPIYKTEGAAVLFRPPGWSRAGERTGGPAVQAQGGLRGSQHLFLLRLHVEEGR